MLTTALEWVVDVDVIEARAHADAARARRPEASPSELAEDVFSKAVWKATATGFVTGLPANPWAALPSGAADLAITLRIEVNAAAKVALLYDPSFFDDEDAKWELLVPVLGFSATSQFFREAAVRGGMGVTRQMIKTVLTKGTLVQFKRIMLKYFGLKVTQKALITKTLPIIGGIIGGGWNFFEVRALKGRVIAYFEGQSLGGASGEIERSGAR